MSGSSCGRFYAGETGGGRAVASKAKVVCRCGKVCGSFKEFDDHLTAKHPKWRKELELSGQLAEDRKVFRRGGSR